MTMKGNRQEQPALESAAASVRLRDDMVEPLPTWD